MALGGFLKQRTKELVCIPRGYRFLYFAPQICLKLVCQSVKFNSTSIHLNLSLRLSVHLPPGPKITYDYLKCLNYNICAMLEILFTRLFITYVVFPTSPSTRNIPKPFCPRGITTVRALGSLLVRKDFAVLVES